MTKSSPLNRLGTLFVAMMLLLGGIVVRLAFLQVRDQGEYEQLGADQRTRTLALPADRGEILDRDQTPLAVTLPARDVYADPRYVTDPYGEALTIAPILGLKPKDVRRALMSDGTFVFIDRQVDADVAQQLKDLQLARRGVPSRAQAVLPLRGARAAGAGVRRRGRRRPGRSRVRVRRRVARDPRGAHAGVLAGRAPHLDGGRCA